ncbi:MAG: NAD-glutamate dehydrogenase [Pseudomonadaceae bacterium]|nr:NAD-glutamate dehydrogenase [Pseudomonadaceae bacterium]
MTENTPTNPAASANTDEPGSRHHNYLLDHLRRRLDPSELELASQFSEMLWSKTPASELDTRDAANDAGMTRACWATFRQRARDSVNIDISNPETARDGWASRHTMVIIVVPDRPFVVDSVLMALSQNDLVVHHFLNVVFATERSATGELLKASRNRADGKQELVMLAEMDRIDVSEHGGLRSRLQATLADVSCAVDDFAAMKQTLARCRAEMTTASSGAEASDIEEALAFLDWLATDNFTFLGYREFSYGDGVIRQTEAQSLGVLRNRASASPRPLAEQTEETRAFLLDRSLLSFSKAGTRSRVHRPAYPDYIGIKTFDAGGRVVGEHGFFGLFTSPVYRQNPSQIPLIRRKISNVLNRSTLNPQGFDGKTLAQVLITWPRDELFQASEDTLFEHVIGATYIQERRRTQVFTRFDPYGLFATCLVYMPREDFNTSVRTSLISELQRQFNAIDIELNPTYSESILVRLQFILRLQPGSTRELDVSNLQDAINQITRDWVGELRRAAESLFDEQQGRNLVRDYAAKLPSSYRERYQPSEAIYDIADIERLGDNRLISSQLHQQPGAASNVLSLKLFQLGDLSLLSEVLPIIENLGFDVRAVQPFSFERSDGRMVAVRDFDLIAPNPISVEHVGERLQDALSAIWTERCDNDRFNTLVVSAELTWREVAVLRAYARYMKQIRFGFSQAFISASLINQPVATRALIDYFHARLGDPDGDEELAGATVLAALDDVALLNEDRVLRRLFELIGATLRTNFYRMDEHGQPREFLSLKFAGKAISNLPKPTPYAEIFVSSPRMEGVHLRGGAVARGGLRWSDRLEDYRTEVLGLVKAQVVKNAVIVPTGAKGGFVSRKPGDDPRAEGLACYRLFIRGLLDVTDNLSGDEVIPPDNVHRLDDDDPYLVVAADKGTATFSDEANAISAEYDFWLGDAFASGGSNGYDHKQMGITARGAWVSVQRHFAERDIDVQQDSISVIGIGDMSGDVFGNGLLSSESLLLVAAFNHLHIFIDPDPDPATSFAERKRLFEMPRSSWTDYDRSLMSAGGDILERSAKEVTLSPEAMQRFGLSHDTWAPDALLRELLQSDVDLIWNGGIGTYVRASTETDADVGDRANDSLRITASELRAKAFGEGGNLGMTQAARIEFSLLGGSVNSDFVDNSAGVDCSDHEVNIKIALAGPVASGTLAQSDRNALLESMTDDVAQRVLANNAAQVRSLSLAQRHSQSRGAEYLQLIHQLEQRASLDRELEGIASDDALLARVSNWPEDASDAPVLLTRPELAVLQAYTKTFIKAELNQVNLAAEDDMAAVLYRPFPDAMLHSHRLSVTQHRLAREIIATQWANELVSIGGLSLVSHISEFAGASVADIVRAYASAMTTFAVHELLADIRNAQVSEQLRLTMQLDAIALIRRAVRWLVRFRAGALSPTGIASEFSTMVGRVQSRRAGLVSTERPWRHGVEDLIDQGAPTPLAERLTGLASEAVALPLQHAAGRRGCDPNSVLPLFEELGRNLKLDWLTDELGRFDATNHWQAMERDLLTDDVVTILSELAANAASSDVPSADAWLSRHKGICRRWHSVVDGARRESSVHFSQLSLVCRKLTDLTAPLREETV